MAPLANEERVSILSYLNQKPLSFKDLEEITGKRGGTLKHHLEQLEQAKYIQQVKSRGRYSITIDGQIAYRLSVWFASCLAPNDE
jgi:DNA-binding transcriptional ArsR family regulator